MSIWIDFQGLLSKICLDTLSKASIKSAGFVVINNLSSGATDVFVGSVGLLWSAFPQILFSPLNPALPIHLTAFVDEEDEQVEEENAWRKGSAVRNNLEVAIATILSV